jgi:hypothetical protein
MAWPIEPAPITTITFFILFGYNLQRNKLAGNVKLNVMVNAKEKIFR